MHKRIGIVLLFLFLSNNAVYSLAARHSERLPLQSDISEAQTRIVGGQPADAGEWPWMAIIADRGGSLEIDSECGGTLIHPQWVLTAAHCTIDFGGEPLSGLDVAIGVEKIDAPPEEYERIEVEKIVAHPEYDNFMLYNDIALLKLARPHSLPVARWMNSDDDASLVSSGTMATAMGWGLVSQEPDKDAETLMEVDLPIVSNEVCLDAWDEIWGPDSVVGTMLCAGYMEGGKDTCTGDSGGPLVVPDGQGGFLVVGLTSWGGEYCGEAGYPGVYTRVSEYADWIESIMQEASNPQTIPAISDWGLAILLISMSICAVCAIRKRQGKQTGLDSR